MDVPLFAFENILSNTPNALWGAFPTKAGIVPKDPC